MTSVVKVFTSSGTFTVPAGVGLLRFSVLGAGANAVANASAASRQGGKGAGFGYAEITATAGDSWTIGVGTGAGASSTVLHGTDGITVSTITASYTGGHWTNTNTSFGGGTGGSTSGGGGAAAARIAGVTYQGAGGAGNAGGGGGGGGINSSALGAGGAASGTAGGKGGDSYLASGSAGGTSGTPAGIAGTNGAGGSGSYATSGNGGNGSDILVFTDSVSGDQVGFGSGGGGGFGTGGAGGYGAGGGSGSTPGLGGPGWVVVEYIIGNVADETTALSADGGFTASAESVSASLSTALDAAGLLTSVESKNSANQVTALSAASSFSFTNPTANAALSNDLSAAGVVVSAEISGPVLSVNLSATGTLQETSYRKLSMGASLSGVANLSHNAQLKFKQGNALASATDVVSEDQQYIVYVNSLAAASSLIHTSLPAKVRKLPKDQNPEANPFQPKVPESVRQLSPELYDFLQQQTRDIYEQHTANMAGDVSFPWEILTRLDVEALHTLGCEGKFYNEKFGSIRARYVQFANMNPDQWSGAPIGLVKASENPWLATNQFEFSGSDLVLGVNGSYTAPRDGLFGWVIFEGVNFQQVFCEGKIEAGAKFGWASDGRVTRDVEPIFARVRTINGLDDSAIAPGGMFIERKSLSASGASQEGTNGGTGISPETQALLDQVKDLQREQSKTTDRLKASLKMLTTRVSAITDQSVSVELTQLLAAAANFTKLADTAADNALSAMGVTSLQLDAVNQLTQKAQTYANEAGYYADSSTVQRNEATVKANETTVVAAAAAESASQASASAIDAGTQATAALTYKTQAETAAGNASTSATQASTSETNAAGSANTATIKASAASTSETNAGNSATAAAGSATSASTSATNANNSYVATASIVSTANVRLDNVYAGLTVEQFASGINGDVSSLQSEYIVTADINGNVNGFKLAGSASGPGSLNLINTDLKMGTGRVIFNNGTFMEVQGVGFGVGNDLIEWYGPTMDIALCSRTNSRAHKTIDGDAFFGGVFSVGTYTNPVTGSDIGNLAAATVGPFATLGGSKQVSFSFGAASNKSVYGGGGTTLPADGTTSATLVSEKSTDGGITWTYLSTINAAGNYHWEYEPADPTFTFWRYTLNCTGSYSFTDNDSTLSAFSYRLRMTARDYTLDSISTDSQTLTIISVEE